MHVGGDYHSVAGSGISSKENLEYNLRYGVKHLTAQPSERAQDGSWDLDVAEEDAGRVRRSMASLSKRYRMGGDYITRRKGPERDRELEIISGTSRRHPRLA